jgi:O-antigen/teichoic acid export membrane protein
VLGRGINFVGLAVITRLFSDSTYGTWVLILATANFFIPITTLRYEIAIILVRDVAEAVSLFFAVLAIAVAVTLAVAASVLFLPSQWLTALSGVSAANQKWLLLLLPTVLLLAVQLLLQTWVTRRNRFGLIGVSIATQTTLTMLLTIVLPKWMGYSIGAAASGGLVGLGASVLVFIWGGRRDLADIRPGLFDKAAARAVLNRFRVYPLFTFPASFGVVASDRIIQVGLVNTFSVAVAGTYITARGLLFAPASILSSSIRSVLVGHGARDESFDVTRTRVLRLLTGLVKVVSPAFAFSIFWVKPIIRFFLGTKWPLLPDIGFACLFPATALVFSGTFDRLFDLVGKQKLSVGLQLASDVVDLIALAVGILTHQSPQTTVLLVCVSEAVTNCIWLTVLLRVIRIDGKILLSLLRKFVLLVAVSGTSHWLLQKMFSRSIGLIFATVLLFVTLLYFGRDLAKSVRRGRSVAPQQSR